MSKDTKEILKTLLANQELIMKHLGISKASEKAAKKDVRTDVKKPAVKEAPAKQGKAKKKN